jgi:hypothetical protein
MTLAGESFAELRYELVQRRPPHFPESLNSPRRAHISRRSGHLIQARTMKLRVVHRVYRFTGVICEMAQP